MSVVVPQAAGHEWGQRQRVRHVRHVRHVDAHRFTRHADRWAWHRASARCLCPASTAEPRREQCGHGRGQDRCGWCDHPERTPHQHSKYSRTMCGAHCRMPKAHAMLSFVALGRRRRAPPLCVCVCVCARARVCPVFFTRTHPLC